MEENGRTDADLSMSRGHVGQVPIGGLVCWSAAVGKSYKPPSGVFGRIGRLVGDQERDKSSYSHTKFDIHPRERKQMLNKCQLVLATGGTVAQDLTMQWSTLGGFMHELSLMVIDEGQQYFFPSNAFMASARSFNMFQSMLH